MILDIYMLIQEKLETRKSSYRVEISRSILVTLVYENPVYLRKAPFNYKKQANPEAGIKYAFPDLVFHQYKSTAMCNTMQTRFCVA